MCQGSRFCKSNISNAVFRCHSRAMSEHKNIEIDPASTPGHFSATNLDEPVTDEFVAELAEKDEDFVSMFQRLSNERSLEVEKEFPGYVRSDFNANIVMPKDRKKYPEYDISRKREIGKVNAGQLITMLTSFQRDSSDNSMMSLFDVFEMETKHVKLGKRKSEFLIYGQYLASTSSKQCAEMDEVIFSPEDLFESIYVPIVYRGSDTDDVRAVREIPEFANIQHEPEYLGEYLARRKLEDIEVKKRKEEDTQKNYDLNELVQDLDLDTTGPPCANNNDNVISSTSESLRGPHMR